MEQTIVSRGSYTANFLGSILNYLVGLQDYDMMALIQNSHDATVEEILFGTNTTFPGDKPSNISETAT